MTGPKITWLGHAGFRIEVVYNDAPYVIYVDVWLENPKYPEEWKVKGTPDDADLILVTHGHMDHSASAPALLAASSKHNCAIISIYEIGLFYQTVHKIDPSKTLSMNKSGTKDLGWCKITMVSADHSSSCGMHQGNIFDGGAAAAFVIRLPQYGDISIYHGGDTGVFLDMQLINELYRPTHLLMPIGGNFTMGPEEAAHACKFFTNARVVIPMHFLTHALVAGTFEDFVYHLSQKNVTHVKPINSY